MVLVLIIHIMLKQSLRIDLPFKCGSYCIKLHCLVQLIFFRQTLDKLVVGDSRNVTVEKPFLFFVLPPFHYFVQLFST